MNKSSGAGTLDPALLAEIIRRVVAGAQPDRIILFGSAARGELGPIATWISWSASRTPDIAAG